MRFLKEEDGAAFVEVALMLPLFVIILVSAAQGAFIVQNLIRVADAATVGARYGTLSGNGNNLTGMQSAAIASANGLPNFNAAATTYCTCLPNGTPTSCTSTCSEQSTPASYVKVATSARVPLLFRIYGASSTFSMNSTSVMRVGPGQ